jgi:hypothetical protein
MIRLFDIQGGKAVPSEHCYTLKFLKDVMDEYPDDYLQIYTYLFYMTCPNPDLNPFFHFPESEKEEVILQEINAEFSIEDDLIVSALLRCRKMYETETSRAYYGIKTALDNLGKVLATETPTFGRDGSAVGILRIAERFDAVRQSYKGVYKDLMSEQQSSVRGGQNLAYDDI